MTVFLAWAVVHVVEQRPEYCMHMGHRVIVLPVPGQGAPMPSPTCVQVTRDPAAPPGAWNDFPNKLRTPVEQAFQDSGAWLVMRSGPGLPGWWYGKGAPKGQCITGSLYTCTDATGLYVCGSQGWVPQRP